MKHRMMVICTLLLTLLTLNYVVAQDAPDYPLDFPIADLTDAQIKEARDCDLQAVPPTSVSKPTACQLAQQALVLAKARGDSSKPADDELELVKKIAALNTGLLLRLDLIAHYYAAAPLIAPPEFSSQSITKLTLAYTFAGLGPSTDYDITITNADKTPVVTGKINSRNSFEASSSTPTKLTATPVPLAKTVDSDVVQAFGAALSDFVPIQTQFSSTPCWDYYPDWTIELTFADGTIVSLVTKNSNVVGIGGPWQTEIDGKFYMQYSAGIQNAIVDLFKALDLKFGETAAMGCGGMNDPLDDAYPPTKTT